MNAWTIRMILGAVAVGALIASGVSAQSASAADHRITGTSGTPASCANNDWNICLYYDGPSSSWYGAWNVDWNLNGNTFHGGNGDGSGHGVADNANWIACTANVATLCKSFTGINTTGNSDSILPDRNGALYFTWNNEQSIIVANN